MRKSATIALATILVLAPATIARSSTTASTGASSDETCFVASINAERAAKGRSRLAVVGDLVVIARRHSARMAEDGTIYHNQNLRNEVGGNWYALGENVGMGPTCESLHAAFMASAPHRANILDGDYNQLGVGVVIKDDTIYVTEVFAGRRSAVVRRPARKPATSPRVPVRPEPQPPAREEARTVGVLLRLIGMDTREVDPLTGAAMGV